MTTAPANIAGKQQGICRIPATYADYLALEDESKLMEWKDGEIILLMPPTSRHQDITGFIYSLLKEFVQLLNLGRMFQAPFEVKLWPDGPSREPDILFISNERLNQLTENRFLGGPDLVVEIVSSSSARTDRAEKFFEYEQAGVREYWVIDPRPGQQQADFYQRRSDGRFLAAPLDDEGTYYSAVLPGFRLNPAWLRPVSLPSASLIMAEIAKDLAVLPDDLRAAYLALYEALTR